MRIASVVALSCSFLLGVGCAHKQQTEVSETVAVKPAETTARVEAAPAPEQNVCSTDTQCKDGSLCLHGRCVLITADLEECSLVRVHFEFNDPNIRPVDESTLQRMARCLRADHSLHVTIEGNADERGTEEYNMMLSSQRASHVETYLVTLGVSAKQLAAVGFGFERPVCKEHDEACWAKNRRAALKPEGAPEKSTRPAAKPR